MVEKPGVTKLVVLGSGGVGKTTLIYRLVSGDYKEQRMTVGFDIESWIITTNGSHLVRASVFDFGGQERFRFFQAPLITGARIALLVFDCSLYRTLTTVPEWTKMTANIPTKRTMLVGTKADLPNGIEEAEIRRYSEELGIDYILVSSKTGFNIDLLKWHLSRIIEDIDSQPPNLKPSTS